MLEQKCIFIAFCHNKLANKLLEPFEKRYTKEISEDIYKEKSLSLEYIEVLLNYTKIYDTV